MNYKVQEHLKPKALSGISNDQISQHRKLYEGYVENANRLIEGVARAEAGSSPWAELKRRLGFEVDGVVLHEYYFGNLASGSTLRPAGDLAADLGAAWGSVRAWREDFAKTGGSCTTIPPLPENIDWEVVEQRYRESKAGRFTAHF